MFAAISRADGGDNTSKTMRPLPQDWQQRLNALPRRCGVRAILKALEITEAAYYSHRVENEEFDEAVRPKLRTRPKRPAGPKRGVPAELPYDDDLISDLEKFLLDIKPVGYNPAADRIGAEILERAIAHIKTLRKERRHLKSQLNEVRVQLHNLKRGTGYTSV